MGEKTVDQNELFSKIEKIAEQEKELQACEEQIEELTDQLKAKDENIVKLVASYRQLKKTLEETRNVEEQQKNEQWQKEMGEKDTQIEQLTKDCTDLQQKCIAVKSDLEIANS